MVICNFVIPVIVLCWRKTHTILRVVIASSTVIIGMWLERFIIIVPTLVNPRLEGISNVYIPTWIEWGELAGSFAMFILLYVLFTKFFPIISIWEIREGKEIGVKEVEKRIRSYMPQNI